MAQEICIPRLGWSMEEGVFVGWLRNDGDMVRAGEPLFELEGEKGLQEVEANDTGILRIPPNAPTAGCTLAVGALLGYLVAAGEAAPWETVEGGTSAAASTAPPVGAERAAVVGNEPLAMPADIPFNSAASNGHGPQAKSSPRARRIAGDLGVDWRQAHGTGNGGRVREADVRELAASASTQLPTPGTNAEIVQLSPRRKTIAARMLASSQQTAPVTLTTRCDATGLTALRQQFKDAGGVVPTYSDIAIKLVALALRQRPEFGARWVDGGLQSPAVDALDIGIAVDTDQGLVVPVVRGVAQKSLAEIATESKRLVDVARSGRASPADLEGGVFTVTNLGGFGIDAFTPIINLPQVAILGLGAIRREPVVLDDDQIAIRAVLTLSLTFDHRAIDGAPAARFLQNLAHSFSQPIAWLLGCQSLQNQY